MYQNIGSKAIKKDLTNIKSLCQLIGNPHKSIPCIHIAGTNGKGTTAHMLSAILQKSGLKVGLYTSPHYETFRERIKINGVLIKEQHVLRFVNQIKKDLEHIQASFFEISVAMAFDHFRNEKVDVSIIETGLGGERDSTNIVDPILSIITNISLDHIGTLGKDKYEIAVAKAGIIKKDIPVVIGRYQASCDHIFLRKAKASNSSLSFASLKWKEQYSSQERKFINRATQSSINIKTNDTNPFLTENIKTTLEAVSCLNLYSTFSISSSNINDGLEGYRNISNYKGRWEILSNQPLTIADSAHNYEAVQAVLKKIESINSRRCHFILGFVKDKDIKKIIALFDPKHDYYFTCPSVARGLKAHELSQIAISTRGLQGSVFETVKEAVKFVLTIAEKKDLIYIGGSSFVVADALAIREELFQKI